MAAYQNQHFVPEFLLKLYNGGHEHMIDIVPMRVGRLRRGVSLHEQASKDWFYDDDGSVERELGTIEGETARIITRMLALDRPPARLSREHQGLVMFVAIQHFRTLAAATAADEKIDKLAKSVLKEASDDPEIVSNLHLVNVTLKKPVNYSMRLGFQGTPLLYDLRMKLIVNTSGRPFLASDAPVILHNRLYGQSGAPAVGLANSGLQIFVPLGPRRALIMYDEDAYEVGTSASNAVKLVNPKHADLINDLQWEAAQNVMFIPPGADEAHVVESWARWQHRSTQRVEVDHTVVAQTATTKRTRLGVNAARSVVSLDLPFVKIKLPPPPPWSGQYIPAARHPEWAEHVTGLIEALDEGRIDPQSFVNRTLKVPRTPRRRR